jgi:hypothetical protein
MYCSVSAKAQNCEMDSRCLETAVQTHPFLGKDSVDNGGTAGSGVFCAVLAELRIDR